MHGKGLKGSDANVFGIRVGVSINLFVKKKVDSSESPRIFYYCTDELWDKKRKFSFLSDEPWIRGNVLNGNLFRPDTRQTWLTERSPSLNLIPLFQWEPEKQRGEKVYGGRRGDFWSLFSSELLQTIVIFWLTTFDLELHSLKIRGQHIY